MKKTLILIAVLLNSAVHAAKEGELLPQCPDAIYGNQDRLDFTAYSGKVVLVDFWATWCPPCKKSMPFLNSLRNELINQGFEIVAINVDENSEEAKHYLAQNPVDYPIAFDPNGKCPGIFDVKAMPSSYLVDKSGKIRHVHLGFRDEDQSVLREQISALLAE